MAERKRLLELAITGLKREIGELEDELKGLGKGIMRGLAVAGAAEMGMPPPRARRRKHRMSADARARIAAAQKARWAKGKKTLGPVKTAGKGTPRKRTRKVSAATKKAASERMKAYWARRKAS